MNNVSNERRKDKDDDRPTRQRRWRLLFALVFAISLSAALFLPVGPTSRLIPVVAAHALPVRSDPAANAVLRVPPSQVRIWFTDALVSTTSRILVENAQNQEVDRRDSIVSRTDPREITVSLPRLPAGTYTVLWVAQSTDDGHVTTGSFVFSIASANGTAPSHGGQSPSRSPLVSSTIAIDGPTFLQIVATWLALLCLTFWLGGMIWETWIFSPGATEDSDLSAAAIEAACRFRRIVPYVLGGLLLADCALIFSETAQLAGSWTGAMAPSLWQAILFGSRFGLFWWMSQGVVLIALALRWWAPGRDQRHALSSVNAQGDHQRETYVAAPPGEQTVPAWHSTVLEMLRRVPLRLAAGWREQAWPRQLELVLGAVLLVDFALSGHATSAPPMELGYALAGDFLHLASTSAWVGGLLYIGCVLLPALYRLSVHQHARVLILGLPRFNALAILSVIVLAMTGPLNASIHLTSLAQLLTTLYGRILVIKIEFFLLMGPISAYHVLILLPRLTRALAQPQNVAAKKAEAALIKGTATETAAPEVGEEKQGGEGISEQAWRLAERMETWLRREAILGAIILLCSVLLSTFYGTVPPA